MPTPEGICGRIFKGILEVIPKVIVVEVSEKNGRNKRSNH